MSDMSRRDLLKWFAVAPTLPAFLVKSASAVSAQTAAGYDGPIVVVVRMLGGNDGLNTVVPVNDDRYFKLRPTIAIAKRDTIAMPGGELGLNPWLKDFRSLMDDGHAAIVQGVGYPSSSRSHSRSSEIFETGSVAEPAPAYGWLGRYLDHACDCVKEPVAGIQFADALGRTLASQSGSSKSIGNPQLLLDIKADTFTAPAGRGARVSRMDYLQQVENDLGEASRQLRRATKGSGARYDYPDSAFGQSLRWTGDMIEAGCPTRLYYATIGSFDTPTSPSFDTHSEELDRHRILFTELGRGLKSFVAQMKKAGQLDRIVLLTFSDFGRQVGENRDGGTDHGDASVMFVAGGKIRAGLLGQPADIGRVYDGGLMPSVDFRQIYANVLGDWLRVNPDAILGERVDPFRVIA
jgi:uncharacterized protein (DUF1501 family)